MELKIGDLILVKGTNAIGKIIEDVTHSKYSHVAIYVGNGQLIEAEGFEKTCSVSADKYKGVADVFRCNSLEGQRSQIVSYLSYQVGGTYDWVLLFLELLRYVFHVTIHHKEPFHCHICSMLGADAYKYIGIYLCPNISYPSPADISESKLLTKIGSL